MVKIARNDPRERLNDYKTALQTCWLSEQGVTSLVFCENSNGDLGDLYKICEQYSCDRRRFEFLSFEGQSFQPNLGKGYGEIGIISYALQHSKILQDGNPLIVKVTGRLVINNIGTILDKILERPDFDVSCDLRGNLEWADSRLFIARKKFLQEYLIPMQTLVDDSSGVNFEHVLGRATHKALGDGLKWIPMMCTPDIQGIAGTCGTQYPKSLTRWIARDMFRRVKNWTIAR